MEKHASKKLYALPVGGVETAPRAATRALVPMGPGCDAGCFSYFEAPLWTHLTPRYTLTLRDVVRYLRSDFARQRTLALRATADESARRQLKARTLDVVCFSGTFTHRDADHLVCHSNLLCIDIDHLDNPVVLWAVRLILITDPLLCVLLLFTSPSGQGVKAVVAIDIAQYPHEEWFDRIRAYLFNRYGLVLDGHCRDVARACFLCWDEVCWVSPTPQGLSGPTPLPLPTREGSEMGTAGEGLRPSAAKTSMTSVANMSNTSASLSHPTPLPTREEQGGGSGGSVGSVESIITLVALQLDAFHIDITPTYDDWLRVAFALSSELGEGGRALFHRVCRHFPGYRPAECDRKYSQCLRSPRRGIGIGTFLWMASMAGIDVKAISRQVWREQQEAQRAKLPQLPNCQTATNKFSHQSLLYTTLKNNL